MSEVSGSTSTTPLASSGAPACDPRIGNLDRWAEIQGLAESLAARGGARPRPAPVAPVATARRLAIALACLTLSALAIAPAHEANAQAPAARTIVLVRHGHYAPDPQADPRLGPGLSPLGVVQAKLAGARLAAQARRFDGLHASPLQRARESAAAMADDFPERSFDVVDELAECTPPGRGVPAATPAERQAQAACKTQLDGVYARFFKPAGGSERGEMLVCHGNVIRYLVTKSLGVDTAAWSSLSVGHASVTTVRVEADGSVRVIGVGDVGHVPPNLRTGALGDPERSLSVTVPAPPGG